MTLTLLPRLMPLKAKVIATLNKQGKKERRKEGRKHLLPPLPSLLPSVFHHHRHHVTGWPRWLEKNILWVLSYPYIFHWNNTQVKRVHIVFYDQVWRDCRHGRLGKHLSQARASVLSWLRVVEERLSPTLTICIPRDANSYEPICILPATIVTSDRDK